MNWSSRFVALYLAVALTLAGSATAWWSYAQTWRSDETVWRRAVEVSPMKLRPRVNHAVALAREGRIIEARFELFVARKLLSQSQTTMIDMAEAAWAIEETERKLASVATVDTRGFVYEDRELARQNQVAPAGGSARWLSRWTLYAQRGASIGEYRAVNLALHIATGLMLALLLRRLRAPAIAALLFVVHPMAVESVMTLSGRAEILAALLVVTSAIIATTSAWCVYLLVGLAAVAAKEFAVIGMVLAPLAGYVRTRRLELLVLVVLLSIATAAGFVWQAQAGEAPAALATWGQWALMQGAATSRMAMMSILPYGQTIDFDYDALPYAVTLLSLAWLGAVGLAAWQLRASRPLLSLGIAWMLIASAPRLIVQTPRSYFNEHQFYLPLIGIVFIAADLLSVTLRWADASARVSATNREGVKTCATV